MSSAKAAHDFCSRLTQEELNERFGGSRQNCLDGTNGGGKPNKKTVANKTKKPIVHVGPKGGRYTVAKTGKKTYV
jgi:hypothetical protein